MDMIDYVLENMFHNRAELFGERCKYLRCEKYENVGPKNGFQSDCAFASIVYEQNGSERTSETFFVKVTPQIAAERPFAIFKFTNEILFFAKVLPFFRTLKPTIDELFPAFYDSHLRIRQETDERGLIVFENLARRGYVNSERASFLDYPHLSLMMRKLGQFHAYSYRAKATAADQFYPWASSFTENFFGVMGLHPTLLRRQGERGVEPLRRDPQYSSKLATVEATLKTANEFMRNVLAGDKDDPLSVLCHGDYLQGNVLFRYVRGTPVDLKMVDLAMCRLASPIVDIALILYLNADQRVRDEHWDDLIDEYYAGLREVFPDTVLPTKESLLEQFRTKSLYAYFVASYFLTFLMAYDNNWPIYTDEIPEEYRNGSWSDIPEEALNAQCLKIGGAEATKALTDILKDMIDRGFI